mmetsp:Transcript_7583/g.6931  ORF Transcript_7583/g.6931 Transcript_7583/m.6931 type:complete len:125 (+) Transcript_7583:554-928(+)
MEHSQALENKKLDAKLNFVKLKTMPMEEEEEKKEVNLAVPRRALKRRITPGSLNASMVLKEEKEEEEEEQIDPQVQINNQWICKLLPEEFAHMDFFLCQLRQEYLGQLMDRQYREDPEKELTPA